MKNERGETSLAEIDDLSASIASLLADTRKAKKARVAQSNAKPADPIPHNPWIYQGVRLIETQVQCLRCKVVHTVPHGLVEVFKHKTKMETWETVLTHIGNDLPDDEYLGKKILSRVQVNGCGLCVKEIEK